jgi:hypothetical protein
MQRDRDGPDTEHDEELAEEERPRLANSTLEREQDDDGEWAQRREGHRHG